MRTLAIGLLIFLFSACASVTYDPTKGGDGAPMTGRRARATIEEALDHVAFANYFDRSVRKVSYTAKGIRFYSINPKGQALDYFLPYTVAEKLRLESNTGDFLAIAPGTSANLPWNFVWKDEKPGRDFVRAAYDLAVAVRTDEANAASALDSFRPIADAYRRSKTGHEFPETALRAKVMAESAFKEKRYLDALEYFNTALEAAPWWPEGHFNRAIILGQQELYAQAVAEMKKFLLLIPEPPNAKEIQEKIYLWEGQFEK